ncbi:Ribonuclease P protein subunit p40 [Galemys pyrenaicus]|uniref:Ribonuclease P protein subunit p40 n=1 Tax=Galemys pyrenaicus TaxID=202257 RepID=A0A8J6A3C1_GALPY|nr:Ribonuclease P protein subunit p40 [Galemys pyrenaicus]
MATLRRLREVPRHLLVCEKSNFAHDKSRHRHLVETHYHNYRVSFLIPECGVLSRELRSLVAQIGPYYSVKDLPLYEFITPEFISTFIKEGSCCALSLNTRIDEDSTVALLPQGTLILSLDKDTYEECGLQGRPSQHSGKNAPKYVVSIDLMELALHPDSKKSQRIAWSFKEKKPLKFDFLLAWHREGIRHRPGACGGGEEGRMERCASGRAVPKDVKRDGAISSIHWGTARPPASTCSSTHMASTMLSPGAEESMLASYFSSYRIQEHQPKVALSTVVDLPCPVLLSGALGGQPEASCSAPELLQWLGAVFSGASLNNTPSDFVSSCCCPQPGTVAAQACLCTITGFVLPQKIHLLLDQLCHYFDEPKLAPWVTLSVQGFADSPVSWRENEHGFQKGGEHLYNFVIFSNQDYWLQMAVGAHDECPP